MERSSPEHRGAFENGVAVTQSGELRERAVVTSDAVVRWIVGYVARTLRVDEAGVDIEAPFERLGLDSATAISMTADLEDWLGTAIDPMLVYEYPTIRAFAHHVAGK